MSINPAPLSITILTTSIKYLTGFSNVIFCAQLGMFSIGVNNPLIKINITRKNHDMNIACCCVSVVVDINIPKPKTMTR